jgi:(p)ppGpp synthase/HD superfamily hydrolase
MNSLIRELAFIREGDAMVRSPDVVAGRVPTFLRDRPVTRAAFAFAARVHGGDRRDADGAPFILHPLEVAALLSSCGCRDEVTAAAMLHDTLEDTEATGEQIEAEFGSEVAHLVRCLTEDGRIGDHRERKSALRDQVADCDCDCEAAKIYAADKLSKVRELRIRLRAEPAFAIQPERRAKLDHYWRSLAMLEQTLGWHPLVNQLRFELEAIRDLPPRTTSRY